MEFITAHWDTIAAVIAFLISEGMALNPNWKYNGIAHAIVELLKKSPSSEPPK